MVVSPVVSGLSTLCRVMLTPKGVKVQRAVGPGQFQAQAEARRILSQMAPDFLCPEDTRGVHWRRNCGLPSTFRCVRYIGDWLSAMTTVQDWQDHVLAAPRFLCLEGSRVVSGGSEM